MNSENPTPRKRPLTQLKAWSRKAIGHAELVAIARENGPNVSKKLALDLDFPDDVARATRWLAKIREDFGIRAFEDFVKKQK